MQEIFNEHVTSPFQFDSSASVASDRPAFQTMVRSNKDFLKSVREAQPNFGFGKLFLKGLLVDTAKHHQVKWGFVDKDCDKFGADVSPNLGAMLSKLSKEVDEKGG